MEQSSNLKPGTLLKICKRKIYYSSSSNPDWDMNFFVPGEIVLLVKIQNGCDFFYVQYDVLHKGNLVTFFLNREERKSGIFEVVKS